MARRLGLGGLVILMIAGLVTSRTMAAEEPRSAVVIPLQCRLGLGPWQPCRMELVEIGSQWTLVVGGRRHAFRHDGQGSVTMRRDDGPWRQVSSRWEQPGDLCWDGLCARGPIPLD